MTRPLRTAVLAVTLALASVPVGYATAAPAAHPAVAAHACTRTSSGKCIKGGEFCPEKDYGHEGWDAKGRVYICKGSRSHPHWEKR